MSLNRDSEARSGLNPGMVGHRDSYNIGGDQISDQAEHTAEIEREAAESRKPLLARLAGRLLRTLRRQI